MRSPILSIGVMLLNVLGACHPAPGTDAVVKVNGNDPGSLRGYVVVNHELNERLIERGSLKVDSLQIAGYLGQGPGSGLIALLGAYGGDVASTGFRNGAPNALNTLLWYSALARFAQDLSSRCQVPPPPPNPKLVLTETFNQLLATMCTWPAQPAQDHLSDLWLALMSYQAPYSEFQVWSAAATNGEGPFLTLSGGKAVRALLLSILMNPYFLLES